VAKTVFSLASLIRPCLATECSGWTAAAIAEIFECQEHTVQETCIGGNSLSLGGLWDASGRGQAEMARKRTPGTCLKQNQDLQ